MSSRETLGRHLVGHGIEVGPGTAPFAVSDRVDVRYVDRLTSVQHRELFPEFPPDVVFPEPDVIADLDTDRLRHIESGSQDFVICSHVLEHLADPLGFLDEAHRVLRDGGALLILLPDRRCTFDRGRAPTPLECLIRDHALGAQAPDDEHILEFLTDADQGPGFVLPDDADELANLIAWHRERSIHVHCWTDEEFPQVLDHCSRELGHGWERVEQLPTASTGMEFGYVLLRGGQPNRRRLGRWLRQFWSGR